MFTSKTKQCVWLSVLSVLVIAFTGWVKQAHSQETYPTKPIEIIVSMAPGGSADLVARLTASYLKDKWGVAVNVVNKTGGNTLPATTELYGARPDGYTILADIQPSSSALAAYGKLPFTVMDRSFLGMVSVTTLAYFVHSASPHKTLADVISEVKRDPDNFTWTSVGGIGGADIAFRQLFKAIGVDVSRTKPVLTTGGSQSALFTAGGNVKAGASTPIAVKPVAKAGHVRILAISNVTPDREPEFPDAPNMVELGYPSVDYVFWVGLSGPPKLPPYILDKWSKTLDEMRRDPEFKSQMAKIGNRSFSLNSDEMKRYIMKESEKIVDLFGVQK